MQEKLYINNGNIMYIYFVMKKYSDMNNALKIDKIIEHIKNDYDIEIESRTIRRNFKVLENKFGLEIVKTDDGYYLEPEDNDFDSSEIRTLVDMVNYSRFVDEKLADMITFKLVSLLNENSRVEFKDYDKYMKNVKTTNKQLFYNIKVLAEAILNKNKIKVDYHRYNLNKKLTYQKTHVISPYTILCEEGQYYIVGYNEDIKGLSYYRLDRMKEIDILKIPVIPTSKERIKEYIESTVGMYGGNKETVQAICDNTLIDDVIDKFGHDTKLKMYNTDSFIMELEVYLLGFKKWALRHLGIVEVIYPKTLRAEILGDLNNGVEKYKKKRGEIVDSKNN